MSYSDARSDRLDVFQQRHAVVAFPVAVAQRYREEHGAWLGAVISYYGLFSLLPFLLAVVTIVNLVFASTPELLREILDALWARLPFLGEEVRGRIEPVQGDPVVVVVALLVSLWGALGVVRVAQEALNQMWGVSRSRRPGILRKIGRGLVLFALAMVALVATTAAAVLIVGRTPAVVGTIGTALLNLLLNLALLFALYRLLTARNLTVREMLPGALLAAFGISLLTVLGGLYVDRVIARTTALYGSFATVIGLFAWVSLAVQVMVIGNLVNVVRVEQLWPRSLTGQLREGDRHAIDLTRARESLLRDGERSRP